MSRITGLLQIVVLESKKHSQSQVGMSVGLAPSLVQMEGVRSTARATMLLAVRLAFDTATRLVISDGMPFL
jgi:hypothetical protein